MHIIIHTRYKMISTITVEKNGQVKTTIPRHLAEILCWGQGTKLKYEVVNDKDDKFQYVKINAVDDPSLK